MIALSCRVHGSSAHGGVYAALGVGLGARDSFTGPTLWVAGDQDALLDLERSQSEYERMPGRAGFVTVRETSHVGVSGSDKVAKVVAASAAEPGPPLPATLEPL